MRSLRSTVFNRSVILGGRKTSVSLEDEFWDGLHEIGRRENISLAKLVDQIDRERESINLSSAIRVHVFSYFYKFYADLAKPAQPQVAAVPQQVNALE